MIKIIKEKLTSTAFTAGMLGAIFLISLAFYFIAGPEKKRAILFFPEDDLVTAAGDFHILPRKENKAENMEVLLAEALLEPFDYHLNETVPEGVIINSLIYDNDDNILFVDLSLEFIDAANDDPRRKDGDRMLEILEKNLRFNFRNLEEVKFTIDQQVPHSYVFKGTSP